MKTGNKIAYVVFLLIVTFLSIFLASCVPPHNEELSVFCGSASKPAMEEAATLFEQRTGVKVSLNFGGSGHVLSQMEIAKTGDIYIPGSPDYIAIAENKGLIDTESVEIVAYLVPAILVQKGNPEGITSLFDLVKPDIEVGIGNPEAVCVGLYAVEILEYNDLLDECGENIVTMAESCSKTATLIATRSVDAVIGWRVFGCWHPDTIDIVFIKTEQLPRIAYIPAALSSFVKNREIAGEFVRFLRSSDGKEIFTRWGYLASESDAREFAPEAKIGGDYSLPESYYQVVTVTR
jgi:molybdate transport system substrate-binding protein